jgi:hypothetical protein
MISRILKYIFVLLSIAWLVRNPGFDSGITFVGAAVVFFKDEIHGIIGFRLLSLTPRNPPLKSGINSKFSFFKPEYINPLIIEDLWGWLSDSGDEVVSVNLLTSNKSNRYYGNIEAINKNQYPIVTARKDHGCFSYQYLGTSFTGIQLIRTWSSGGGSGVFESIVFVTLNEETAIKFDLGGAKKVDRLILKKIASLPLGDRYQGIVRYKYGLLTISQCTEMHSIRTKTQRLIIL